ncbi:MAG TPA: ATP-binding cassette domain-containing protein [Steroidobacteraceae bacterium]|nr:ATP-binding cassette domain-containing protein [Steroidobacteraceae bacterium]
MTRGDEMTAAIEIQGLNKSFGDTRAIADLDLTIPRGATYGFIGPSGAGKTTAIRMIMAILFPDSGRLSVLGRASALEAKSRIGYLPEERGVYRRMRVGDFLAYMGQLKGATRAQALARADIFLTRLGLPGTAMKKCEDLSKGMLQRVQFIAAIINQPELIILDEPFSGLDPVSVRLLKDLIVDEQRRGATIIFSTHVMAHAEELCQHVVMINRGRKVLDEPMTSLARQYDRRTIRLVPLDPAADLMRLAKLPGIERVLLTDEGCEVSLAGGTDPWDAMRTLTAAVAPARIEFARVRLEDVFIRLVGGDSASPSDQALRQHLQGLSAQGALT